MAENVNGNSQATVNHIQWHIRPNTQDLHILSEVYEHNCYRLPDRLPDNTVVIDIGANIGAFSGLALERGAAAVYAYEPDRDNWEQFGINVFDPLHVAEPFHNVKIYNAAVVGDSNPRTAIAWKSSCHKTPDGAYSTGGKNIFMLQVDSDSDEFEEVPTVRISDILGMVHRDHPDCDIWIKLDCEGSEYQILDSLSVVSRNDLIPDGSSWQAKQNWQKVSRIFGEAHATHDGFDPDITGPRDWSNVQRVLTTAGYNVHVQGNGPFRLFFAQKREITPIAQFALRGEINLKPCILIVGDAVHSTGFAACTHALADHLHANSWTVHILGINYYGDPHTYPYTIHPSHSPLNMASDNFGVERLPSLIHELKPDLVIILQDPWNIRQYLDSIKESGLYPVPPIIGWLAVDSKNQKTAAECNGLYSIIAWTEFGKAELIAGGYRGPVHVVPLGVDTDRFRPMDKAECRKQIFGDIVAPDDYIIGVVGRNQCRKRIDLAIEYFAEWLHGMGDINTNRKIWLYLHIAPTGEVGCDIPSLIKFHGINGHVIVNSPPAGMGLDPDLMVHMYNSLDVLLCTSQAEGWNLPALEAMACGVPCILPDSGGHDWAREAGDIVTLVPCTSHCLSAPINNRRNGMHTVGGIMDKNAAYKALNDAYVKSHSYYHKFTPKKLTGFASVLTWTDMAVNMELILRGYLPAEFRARTLPAPTHTDLMISPEAIDAMEMPDTTPAVSAYDSHKWTGTKVEYGDTAPAEWISYCSECGMENKGNPDEFPDLVYPRCEEMGNIADDSLDAIWSGSDEDEKRAADLKAFEV